MLLHGRWSMLFCGRKDETSIFIANVTFSAEYVTIPLTNDKMVASCLLSEILQQGSCVTDVMNYDYTITLGMEKIEVRSWSLFHVSL